MKVGNISLKSFEAFLSSFQGLFFKVVISFTQILSPTGKFKRAEFCRGNESDLILLRDEKKSHGSFQQLFFSTLCKSLMQCFKSWFGKGSNLGKKYPELKVFHNFFHFLWSSVFSYKVMKILPASSLMTLASFPSLTLHSGRHLSKNVS